MFISIILRAVSAFLCFTVILAAPLHKSSQVDKRRSLQDIVTWDAHSILVRGERIIFYSGEFHLFRLPVPGLWPDVFQKIKAMGYTGVSFYTDWALLEGEPGVFNASGIFDLQPFFEAAAQSGVYLLARPGPYMNGEASGGGKFARLRLGNADQSGFPGWLSRLEGRLRTMDSDYLEATSNYMSQIGCIIAGAQITNGGPVILVQPENEYSSGTNDVVFSDGSYMAFVEQQLRDAGIVVPLINNDVFPYGLFAPGNGTGSVDIYGYDNYPLTFDCKFPNFWKPGGLPTDLYNLHMQQSPTTPNSIIEFEGGAINPWGGAGIAGCVQQTNEVYERVFVKNTLAHATTIFNTYMTYGGTNWGNLGQPHVYTSYDYGATIDESRQLTRAKYSEAKLIANFVKASPAFLTAIPYNVSSGYFTDSVLIATSPMINENGTNFYVVRHTEYEGDNTLKYRLKLATRDQGHITVPQIGNTTQLSLSGRDSKIHVTDYQLGNINLQYSTAEIFTWQKSGSRTVLILYGEMGETHELAVSTTLGNYTINGATSATAVQTIGQSIVFQWSVTASRQVMTFQNLQIYLLWRNDAYNWWSLELEAPAPISNYTSPSKSSVIVNAGYLLRTTSLDDSGNLYLVGDTNRTTDVEVISGMNPRGSLYFNGHKLATNTTQDGTVVGTISYSPPDVSIPDLSTIQWKAIDSLPETSDPQYSDAKWTQCDNPTSNNSMALTTPFSMYASDYGYHGGSLMYRGHFMSDNASLSPNLTLLTQGGLAYGYAVWLNETPVYGFPGSPLLGNSTRSFPLGKLRPATPYTITMVMDHMGLTENQVVGSDTMKEPRGILGYNLTSYPQNAVSWSLTGNLGGESYADKVRGPANEGGLFAERQGYHLPQPPNQNWTISSPISNGISSPGIMFYSISFNLSLPTPEWDIPLSFVFNTTASNSTTPHYRCQLYVNGYQFGKYVNNIGPQTSFPVPEGILNYQGENWVGLTLWAFDRDGAKLDGFSLQAGQPILTGRGPVALAPQPAYQVRIGAY